MASRSIAALTMRKRISPAVSVRQSLEREAWINLEGLAEVEVTSEHRNHPVEGALLPGSGSEWRASEEGRQTIRILFDNPQDLTLIHLIFTEENSPRTQEFVLRAGTDPARPLQEIIRQQYNFTPVSSEVEDYKVDLKEVRVLELEITPLISGGGVATLTELRVR